MLFTAKLTEAQGKPARFAALKKFVEYIEQKEGVWVTTVSNKGPAHERSNADWFK